NIQAKLIPQWLEQKGRKEAGRHTAIVLADEKLLPTVVSNIPPGIPVIITTGYPLALSPAASLLNLLITLRTDGLRPDGCSFRLKAVSSLLTHPYIIYISDQAIKLRSKLLDERKYFPTCKELTIDEGTGLLFRQPAEPGDTAETITWMAEVMEYIGQHSGSNDDPFFQETIFRSFTLINRIKLLSDRGLLDIKPQTLERLLSQIVSSTSVPFHGEPAEGVQVMGVLETRNLDFDHILFLSCNEGNMPKGVNDSSFIPYSIRKFYGLTTIDNKVAIYAYYFNRLIQRATDITLTYNTTTEGTHTSEMSRFMLQMMVEGPHTISRESLLAGQTPMRTVQKAVSKTDDIIRKLLTPKKEAKLPSISPSALGMYLNCQLRFFFAHVAGLREDEDEEDEDIDARIFGNIFHSAAEFLYCGKIGRILQAEDLRKLHKEVDSCVEKAFVKELFGQDPTTARLGRLNGLQEINSEVIKKYLHRLVEADMAKAPLTILATEKWVEREFSTMVGGKVVTCKFGGIIDRVDRTESDGKIRIVDYKTGRYPSSWPKTVDEIFDSERNTSIPANYYLQTMLYSSIVRAQNPQTPVVPALLYIQRASNKDYDPTLTFAKEPIGDISDYDDEFNQMLQQLVGEMFSTDIDFAPTTDRTRCERCPFAQLCC
ncbi:MAG: PD-(D/E)XK nuclease family protein, partial [Prevotella sp.]|nr:PD-(D/E)XK nuclease family protein [Prevotella sp.]